MREALLKKWYGIPVALLLLLLISVGVTCAMFLVANESTTTKIVEPISVTGKSDFDATMYPGASNTWTITVKNESEAVAYDVLYLVADGVDDEVGVSVTTFTIGGEDCLNDLQGADGTVGVGDNVINELDASTTENIVLTITAEYYAPPQSVNVKIKIER